jgi:hypothetical protein
MKIFFWNFLFFFYTKTQEIHINKNINIQVLCYLTNIKKIEKI